MASVKIDFDCCSFGFKGGVGTGDDQAVWGHWEEETYVGRWKMAFGSMAEKGR